MNNPLPKFIFRIYCYLLIACLWYYLPYLVCLRSSPNIKTFIILLCYLFSTQVNYTISYRMDSSIYVPYHNYVPTVASHGADTKYQLPSRNYATGKSKMVAWFVSNCHSYSPRIIYAEELSRYVPVRMLILNKC